MKSACRIYKEHIATLSLAFFECVLCDLYRIFVVFFRINRNADSLTYDLQLLYCGGTVYIARGEHGVLSVFFEKGSELCRVSSLSRALKTDHHYYRGRLRSDLYFGDCAAHESCELFIYYFYDLLCRDERFEDLCSHCALCDCIYKAADYFEIYVRFEKGELYCAHTLAYVFFRELSFISEFLESFGEFFLKILKHFTPLLRFPP